VATVELTNENFENTVNENPMVIVDFWAPGGRAARLGARAGHLPGEVGRHGESARRDQQPEMSG